jgi:hypothetical protein
VRNFGVEKSKISKVRIFYQKEEALFLTTKNEIMNFIFWVTQINVKH